MPNALRTKKYVPTWGEVGPSNLPQCHIKSIKKRSNKNPTEDNLPNLKTKDIPNLLTKDNPLTTKRPTKGKSP